MREEERALMRDRADRELRLYRALVKKARTYPGWLRRVRQSLGLHVTDIAKSLDVNKSVIFRLEKSEDRKSISLRALEKAADAMDCRLVYAIVPRNGLTLMELAERQQWKKRLRKSPRKRRKG